VWRYTHLGCLPWPPGDIQIHLSFSVSSL
jgi:hypothetical protein